MPAQMEEMGLPADHLGDREFLPSNLISSQWNCANDRTTDVSNMLFADDDWLRMGMT